MNTFKGVFWVKTAWLSLFMLLSSTSSVAGQKQINIGVASINVDAHGNERIKIHADKVKPLARLGGGEYAGITAPFALARPK